MRTWQKLVAVTTSVAAIGLTAPAAGAETATYCGITWGSLSKSDGSLSSAPLTNVRAGRHECFDRLVIDIAGASNGFTVSYASPVYDQAGNPMSLRGGAFLAVNLLNPAYNSSGASTYNPTNRQELVNVQGWQSFRQVSWGGSYEGYSTIGLGVRARLPFRAFSLDGPGSGSRIVIDVAHKW